MAAVGLQPKIVEPGEMAICGGIVSIVQDTVRLTADIFPQLSIAVNMRVCE